MATIINQNFLWLKGNHSFVTQPLLITSKHQASVTVSGFLRWIDMFFWLKQSEAKWIQSLVEIESYFNFIVGSERIRKIITWQCRDYTYQRGYITLLKIQYTALELKVR